MGYKIQWIHGNTKDKRYLSTQSNNTVFPFYPRVSSPGSFDPFRSEAYMGRINFGNEVVYHW